jgi:hypothetical protein
VITPVMILQPGLMSSGAPERLAPASLTNISLTLSLPGQRKNSPQKKEKQLLFKLTLIVNDIKPFSFINVTMPEKTRLFAQSHFSSQV